MTKAAVLIVGSGGREHALAWKLGQSPAIHSLFIAPGNAGTAQIGTNVAIAATDLDGIVRFVADRGIDLTVIGPEAPLAAGLADHLRAGGHSVVGPTRAAARIESSKIFAKQLMDRAGVPTARWKLFNRPEEAWKYCAAASYPLVVKADGLAAGKGVVVCAGAEEARTAIRSMMIERVHGTAGARILIEEALRGPEVSLLALVDGERVVPLPIAQDHKRLGDGDAGPNTGGMGAYAPVPFLNDEEGRNLGRMLLEPIVAALAAAGSPYRGILFAGLMLTEQGPRVLEYNCRFGDPETQVILPLIQDDLFPWLQAVAGGCLAGRPVIAGGSAVGVVLASAGYPDVPETGVPIQGLHDLPPEVMAFHGCTTVNEGQTVTAGGRVLTVVGRGPTVEQAYARAYAAPVHFARMQRRSDIARQARIGDDRDAGLSAEKTEWFGRRMPIISSGDRPTGDDYRRIAVLAGGSGTNLQALLDASAAQSFRARVAVVVSYNPRAYALKRARQAGVPGLVVELGDRHDAAARSRLEEELLEVIHPFDIDLIVLAGWMLVLSARFLERCPCPVINVHPALLPAAGEEVSDIGVPLLRGTHAVRTALALRLPYTGVSIHSVTAAVDAGPVLLRERVPIEPEDTEATLYARIKRVEHRLLPLAVHQVLAAIPVGGVCV